MCYMLTLDHSVAEAATKVGCRFLVLGFTPDQIVSSVYCTFFQKLLDIFILANCTKLAIKQQHLQFYIFTHFANHNQFILKYLHSLSQLLQHTNCQSGCVILVDADHRELFCQVIGDSKLEQEIRFPVSDLHIKVISINRCDE